MGAERPCASGSEGEIKHAQGLLQDFKSFFLVAPLLEEGRDDDQQEKLILVVSPFPDGRTGGAALRTFS